MRKDWCWIVFISIYYNHTTPPRWSIWSFLLATLFRRILLQLFLALSVFSAMARRLMDVSSELTWLGPIPACNIPISGQQLCRLQKIFNQFKTGYIFQRLNVTVTHRQRVSCLCQTLVFLGCPHSLGAFCSCGTHLSRRKFLPHSWFIKSFPNPKLFLVCSLLDGVLFHMTYSHRQAPSLTSQVQLHVCPLPEIRTSRKKHFRQFYHFHSALFSFLSTNFSEPCLSETPIFLAWEISGKESRHYVLLPIMCCYAQYRMRSAILRNQLNS